MISRKYSVSQNMSQSDTLAVLDHEGIGTILLSSDKDSISLVERINNGNTNHLDLVILDLPYISEQHLRHIVEKCVLSKIPTLAIVPADNVLDVDSELDITDFITSPIYEDELILRAKRAINVNKSPMADDVIVRDDLIINPTNYEVTVKGKRVDLRFKEYELLLVLSSNPGRVYDRATLLNQIWGYDYFGGTRTVDVHIRRLRSKIENNPDEPYIETIWNVGYRFRSIGSA